ncbi:glycolate oxidase [Amorphoplanes nipponensis]|uniref:Glycolate oxidase n=1 Tax=Actinoplanes nipponensis TaxID=135950 RepID=A0A919MUZ2_9ACTN|nr:FAD-binding oxidoreductase [Actinoplanes nipponensis]GIE50645.1 glycolate oxidase [Actinoplanes nipponensis]
MWTTAGAQDTVAGVPARFVAAPASTEEAAAVLAAAARDDLAVVVRGGGTKLDWGVPPRRLDLIVDTRRLTGVVEHAAGDLITVVRAGTPLAALDLPGQQLALDSPLPGATVGGTVAVNTSGPRRMLYGTARDLLIGVTVVRPDGRVAHSGGKVVKNVAGYDLGKLFTGAYGTLGLVTECAFRLHPVPPVAAIVRRTAPADRIGALLAAVRAEQAVPSAVELDAPAEGEVTLAVLVEGTAAGVRDRAARLEKVLGGPATDEFPPWWGRYPWDSVGMKLTVPLSRVPDLLGLGAAVRGSAGTGVLYADVPVASAPAVVERLRAAAVRAGGHAVVLTAPPAVREVVDMWGPVAGLALMRRVKDRFDPEHRFAPGRFVGGI